MKEMLNNKVCPKCSLKNMLPARQGEFNPNPRSKTLGILVCLNCYMDEVYASLGVEH